MQRSQRGKTKEVATVEAAEVVLAESKGKGKASSLLNSKRKTTRSSIRWLREKVVTVGYAGRGERDGIVLLQSFFYLEEFLLAKNIMLLESCKLLLLIFGMLVKSLPEADAKDGFVSSDLEEETITPMKVDENRNSLKLSMDQAIERIMSVEPEETINASIEAGEEVGQKDVKEAPEPLDKKLPAGGGHEEEYMLRLKGKSIPLR